MPSEGQKPTKCAGASVRARKNGQVSFACVLTCLQLANAAAILHDTYAYLGRKQRGLFCKFVFVLCSHFLSCVSS